MTGAHVRADPFPGPYPDVEAAPAGQTIGLDQLPVAVLVCRASGWATVVNPAWSRLSGQRPETSLAHGWVHAVDPADRALLLAAVGRCGAGEPPACGPSCQEPDELVVGMGRRRVQFRVARRGFSDIVLVATDAGSAPRGSRDALTDVVGWLVPELSAVGFSLASQASVLGEPARSGVTAAMERLDELMDAVRRAGRDLS